MIVGLSRHGCSSDTLRAVSRPLHSQPGRAPFRKSILKPPNLEAAGAQDGHRLERERAIRPTTVGDDLLLGRQFREALNQLRQWNVQGPRQMTEIEFVFRPNIE
jgi:hypothetical protein